MGLELGGPWLFYKQFQAAHGITDVLSFVKSQSAFSSDHSLWVPLVLRNDTDAARDLVLHASLPEGWTPADKEVTYHLAAHSTYPAQLFLTAPPVKPGQKPEELRWTLSDRERRSVRCHSLYIRNTTEYRSSPRDALIRGAPVQI